MSVLWIALAVALAGIWYAVSQCAEAIKATRDVERRLIELQDQLRLWGGGLPHPDDGRIATAKNVSILENEMLVVERRLEGRIDEVAKSLNDLGRVIMDIRHALKYGSNAL